MLGCFFYVPDEFKTQEMLEVVVKAKMVVLVAFLICYPDEFKTQEMCTKALQEDPDIFKYAPDWFVTAGMLEDCDEGEWLEAFRQRKVQKAKFEEELLSIAWYPSRVINWCFDADEKQGLEKLLKWRPNSTDLE